MSARIEAAVEPVESRYLNRELSDLAFVRRVLEEAENACHPLVEQLKFLAITGLLLDEFYRTRVPPLRKRAGRVPHPDFAARTELDTVERESGLIRAAQARCWHRLREELAAAGISITTGDDLTADEAEWLARRFESRLAPDLEPVVGNAAEGLPFIKDGELVLVVELLMSDGTVRNALVPLSRDLPRFIELERKRLRFIALENVVTSFFGELFAGNRVVAHGLARVVREGNLELAEDAEDLPAEVQAAVERRDRAAVIRLEVDPGMPERLRRYLAEELGLVERATALGAANENERLPAAGKRRGGAELEAEGEAAVAPELVAAEPVLVLADMMQLVDALRGKRTRDLRFPPVEPAWPEFVGEFDGDFFAAVAAADRLLHFPFDDFDVVTEFLEQAAEDPEVVAIRQTLYRTGDNSAVVKALARAARHGKNVTAVVELEAREDERANIALADKLGKAGATVVFGLRKLKIHVKALEVVRREAGGLKAYVNFATGNYHRGAGRAYTDLSLWSARPELAADTAALFDYLLDGQEPRFTRISIAPTGLRPRLDELIARETAHAVAGRPAAIWLKVNKLADDDLIEALYRAAAAGVAIDAVVRGVCCLRPGVAGLSERIRVRSVVGRFLEHSRIVCFGNGHGLPSDGADVYLSSADWMSHKLDRRVEALVPIDDADLRRHIQEVVMRAYFRDEAQSWQLGSDGGWRRAATAGPSAQALLGQRQGAHGTRARIVRSRR